MRTSLQHDMPTSTLKRFALASSLALSLLLLGACDPDRDFAASGPLRTDPVSIDLGHADRANVQLNIGAGELDLRGGSPKLLTGNFEYNVPDWKPKVESSTSGAHSTITIRQPEHVRIMGDHHYNWDLALNNKVMIDLGISCGAGRARLDLGDLDLRSVEVHMGAGQVDLDLRGHPIRDYDVSISGGIGQATVYLPQGIGIHAEAHGGIGSIDVSGVPKKGNYYENDLYDTAKVNLHLKVDGGIGQIRIIG